MTKETIEIMVEGGKATAGPQIGQSLAPLGVNIQDLIKKINEKTASFKGMKVPVKITVEKEDKTFNLEVGSPPTSELIKKEINLDKASGEPNKNKVGNLAIEQVIKIAKMKLDSMLVNDFKLAVKSVIGSCNSMGILVEGEEAKLITEKINKDEFNKEIQDQKTEVPQEKAKQLQQQLKEVQEKIKKEAEKEKAEKEAEKTTKEEIVKKETEIEAKQVEETEKKKEETKEKKVEKKEEEKKKK